MRGLPLILLLLIPAFIALGHDIYLFYIHEIEPLRVVTFDALLRLLQEKWKFAALGYIWTTYDVESYKLTVESTSKEDWAVLDWLLTFKAFFVGLGFAGIFLVPFGLMALFGKGPLASEGGSGVVYGGKDKKSNPLKKRDETNQYKYKRK